MAMTREQKNAKRRLERTRENVEHYWRQRYQNQMEDDSFDESAGLLTPEQYDARDHLLVAAYWGHHGDLERALAEHEPVAV